MSINVKQRVWVWLQDDGREVLLWSDLTRGLGRLLRKESRQVTRGEVRAALYELQAAGLLSLTPTANGKGRTGLVIEVLDSTHEERKP